MIMTEPVAEYGETPIWLFFYDVQSENGGNLKEEERDWLRSQRVEIWYKLRYKYRCVPLQFSVWLIRGEETHKILEELKNVWLADYAKNKFSAHISIFPVKTTDEGYKSFKLMEFDFILEWLGKIEKALTKAINIGNISKKNVQAHQKKIQLLKNILNEDFDDTFPNYRLAQDSMMSVDEKLHIVQNATGANIIMP